jgi:hypothetical protein
VARAGTMAVSAIGRRHADIGGYGGSPPREITALAEGDVPGGTGSGNATGGDGEEAAWLDLVARFDAPAPAAEEAPWPDREDLAGPVHATPPAMPPTVPEALPREPPTNPTGLPGLPVLGGTPALPGQPAQGAAAPDQPWPPLGAGPGPRDVPSAVDPADEHYIPPVPPPLPRIDPVTKGAWLALFGGPLYLLISTAVGAPISGLAAFLAVAAFVGGFVVIVLRMDNGRPPDSGSDDDGAVV